MKHSRRAFLAGTALSLLASRPSFAWLHRSGSSTPTPGFNGGKSQINFNLIEDGQGEFPFINIVNQAQSWNYNSAPNQNGQVSPANMDTNGYPTSIQSGGYSTIAFIPPTTVLDAQYGTHNFVCRWVGGNGSTAIRNPGTLVSGSTSGNNGRFVFTPNASAQQQSLTFGVNTMGSPYISQLAIMHVNEEAAWLAGELFTPRFKQIVKQGGFGVFRFLNWDLTNNSSITTWGTRKPQNYFSFNAPEYRASIWAGLTSEGSFNGFDYAISFTDPIYGSGAPVDKQTITLQFDQSGTDKESAVTFTGTLDVNWTAHGFSGNELIGWLDNPPSNFNAGTTYYVLAAGLTTNTFRVGLTAGGTAQAFGTASGFTCHGVRVCTLNLNGTGAVPIKVSYGGPTNGAPGSGSTPYAPAVAIYATMIYDADLNAWLKSGGDNTGSQTLQNGVPYEVMLQLCVELGAHPWFASPQMACDPMTDFHTGLATLCKATNTSWMIPRFEGWNENWNFDFSSTSYSQNKAFAHWQTQFTVGQFDYADEYGKICSTIGQAVNKVYGNSAASVGVGYQVMIGSQFDTWQSAGANGNQARYSAANYVNQSQAAQSGYTKDPATKWATHSCTANYFIPVPLNTGQATTDANTWQANAAVVQGAISGGVLTLDSSQGGGTGIVDGGTILTGQTILDYYGFIPAGVTITGGSGLSWTISNSSISIIDGALFRVFNSTAVAAANNFVDGLFGTASFANLAYVKAHFTTMIAYTVTLPANGAGNALKTTCYEGGYGPDFVYGAIYNALFTAAKYTGDLGLCTTTGGTLVSGNVVTGNYADLVSLGVEFPSAYLLGGNNNGWSINDPDIYISPQLPEFLAIAAFN